jgi:RimJ/RimL family protein N-acetyltransferase
MIETTRTYLRAIEREDIPIKTKWMNNPVVRETLILTTPVSVAKTEIWFDRIINDPTREDYIIVFKETEEPIGYAGYVKIDRHHSKAEPFIAIGEEKYWGIGLGTEIVHKLLDFGFNEMGFNRLYGFMLDNNPGALRMDMKAGFKQEGILKQDVLLHGEFHDFIMLGITKDVFNKEHKNR